MNLKMLKFFKILKFFFLMKLITRKVNKSIYVKIVHFDNYIPYCGIYIQVVGEN